MDLLEVTRAKAYFCDFPKRVGKKEIFSSVGSPSFTRKNLDEKDDCLKL